MKFIKTSNQIIELVETDKQNNVISSNGFQLGELYFQIKNKKVSFYLNDSEKPFDSFIWSIDLPITIDGETYATEDEASAALSKIMVLEDINELKERLDAEILRSTNEDTKHDVLISGLTDDLEDEIARATSAETALDDKIDAEVSRAIQKENAILNKVNLNTERISGLSDALDVEIQNRIAADAQLQNVISIESEDRRNADALLKSLIDELGEDLEDETARALSAETRLEDKIDAAISADTRIEQKLDDEISRAYSAETLINQALANEVVRAVSAETRIEIKLDNEIQERKDADIVLSGAIDSLSAYCEDTYAKKEDLEALEDKVDEAISSITDDLQAEIARATAREDDIAEDLEDEFHRAQAAEHLLEDKIVTERERALDAEEELREMIQSLELSGVTEDEMKDYVSGYTYSKDESDAKYMPKNSAYTKTETDVLLSQKQDKLISGVNIKTINNQSLLGSGNIEISGGTIDAYTKAESDARYQPKLTAGDNISIVGNVISATDTKYSAGTNVQISGNVISAKDTTYSAGSGISISDTNVISVTGGSTPIDAYTKAESDAKFATITNFNSHSGNTNVHVTTTEKNTWNQKQDKLTAGDNIDITNNVISTVTKFWCGTQTEYDAITIKDPNTVYMIHD